MLKLRSLNEFFSRKKLKIKPLPLCKCAIGEYRGKRTDLAIWLQPGKEKKNNPEGHYFYPGGRQKNTKP